jgi:hypothetical protein
VYEVVHAQQKLHIQNAHKGNVVPWKKVEYLENRHALSVLPPSSYDMVPCQLIDCSPSQVLVMRPDFSTLYLKRPKDIKVVIGKSYRILFYQEHAHWM